MPRVCAPSKLRTQVRVAMSQTCTLSLSVETRVRPSGDRLTPNVVAADAPLAVINDVFGRRLEMIRADSEALVLGHADSSLAMPGVSLFAMAHRREKPRSARGPHVEPPAAAEATTGSDGE